MSPREALELAIQHSATLRQSATALANTRSNLVATAQLSQTELAAGATNRVSRPGADATLGTAGAAYSRDLRTGGTLSLSGDLALLNTGREGSQAGLELALPLMRGRGKSAEKQVAIDQAAIDFDRERLQYFIDRQRLIEQVIIAYYNAVRAREQIAVQKRAVAIAQQATDDAQKRLDAGLITEIDVTRAKIQLSSSQEALVVQEASSRNTLDELVLLLGLPVGATTELTAGVPGAPANEAGSPPNPPMPGGAEAPPSQTPPIIGGPGGPSSSGQEPLDLDAAIREALANRPELKVRDLDEEDARVQLRVARDQKRPRADLTANLSALGLSLLTGSGIGRVLTSVLGLRLSQPVNRTVVRENQATAERNLEQIARMREFDRQGIVEEVRSLVRAQETARTNIALLTENLKVANLSYRLAQRLIEEGLADNRNLLDAQSSLTSTESSLANARIVDYLTSVSLARALGRDLMKEFDLPAIEPGQPLPPAASTPTRETRR
jgi:outer membrane protein TolC